MSVRAEWLRQSGRAPSEPSETPRWRITQCAASIPCVALHGTLRSPFRRFFLLCRSPISNKHAGFGANCDHISEQVHSVHACIVIAMGDDAKISARAPCTSSSRNVGSRWEESYDTSLPWGSMKPRKELVRPKVGKDKVFIFVEWQHEMEMRCCLSTPGSPENILLVAHSTSVTPES
jgi:hypothetical protein